MTHRPTTRRFTGTPPTRALRLGDAPYLSLLAGCGRDLEALPRRMVRLATDSIVYQVRRARRNPSGVGPPEADQDQAHRRWQAEVRGSLLRSSTGEVHAGGGTGFDTNEDATSR